MPRNAIPTWRIVLDAAHSLTGRGVSPFTLKQLLEESAVLDPSRPQSTMQVIIQGMTANASGGPKSACGEVLWRVDRGLYRLIESDAPMSAPEEIEPPPLPRPTPVPGTPMTDRTDDRRIILIGCVASKRPNPAKAKDLYTSSLFSKRRRYAESKDTSWFILSAEHGLLHPEQPVAPYDRSLQNASTSYVKEWAQRVAPLIVSAADEADVAVVEVHAGSAYLPPALRSALESAGLRIDHPVEGLRIGEHLAWYGDGPDSRAPASTPAESPSALQESVPEHPSVVSSLSARTAIAARLADETIQTAGLLIPLADDEAADLLVKTDAFAFLVAVIADYQVKAEWAWRLPYDLSERLGGLSPQLVAARASDTIHAFRNPSPLHRFPDQTAEWIVEAAQMVIDRYAGDAEQIWNDQPTAVELQRRLNEFKGISQKKAAMAVEILERIIGVDIAKLEGSDIAYDVHVRRVFLRTGLAQRDDVRSMVEAARELWPQRPGALDGSAWHIGRTWCRPTDPLCDVCLLDDLCPRLLSSADGVRGA